MKDHGWHWHKGKHDMMSVVCHLLLTVCLFVPSFGRDCAGTGTCVGLAGCARQTQPPPKNPFLQGATAATAGCPMLLATCCSSAVLQADVGGEGSHKRDSVDPDCYMSSHKISSSLLSPPSALPSSWCPLDR